MFQSGWTQFYQPTKIHLEYDSLHRVGLWVSSIADRVLLLRTEDDAKVYADELLLIEEGLKKHTGGLIVYDSLPAKPTPDDIDSVAFFTKQASADTMLIVGSRDIINWGKAIALLTTNQVFGTEIIQGENKFRFESLPIIIVPLEPTMGEEMLGGFFLLEPKYKDIVFVHNESVIPKACFYDPKLSTKLSRQNASKIVGCLITYCIEALISRVLNPFSETLLSQALTYASVDAIAFSEEAYKSEYSMNIFWSSAFLGSCINATSLGLSWAVAKVMEKNFNMDFQHVMCILLPYVMEFYLTSNPQILVNVAKIMGQDISSVSKIEAAISSVEACRMIFSKLKLPSNLEQINFDKQNIPKVAEITLRLPHIQGLVKETNKQAIESIILAGMQD